MVARDRRRVGVEQTAASTPNDPRFDPTPRPMRFATAPADEPLSARAAARARLILKAPVRTLHSTGTLTQRTFAPAPARQRTREEGNGQAPARASVRRPSGRHEPDETRTV